MNSKKVLVVVGDASETMDTLYPIFRLQEAQFEPVVAVWDSQENTAKET